MKDFKRSNDRGGRDDRGDRGFGRGNKFSSDRGGRDFKKPRFNDRDGDRPMFPAVCDDCGNSCQVPFRPSGDKPVRCDNCFGKGRDNGFSNDRGGRDFSKPAFSKNVYRDTSTHTPDFKSDFMALAQKLDLVISLLQANQPAVQEAVKPKRELSEIITAAIAEKTPKAKKSVKTITKKVSSVKKIVTKKVAKVATKKAVKKVVKK